MLAIYKKELRQYFHSMIGFAFLAFFLAIVGIYTWVYNFANGLGNFEITLSSISFLFVLLIPILTMRILAEENHQKTNQLLYTSPISVTRIVLGKYFSVLTLFLIGIAVISLYPLIIRMYGSDVRLSMAYSSIIGFFLLGAACMAIGLFISSLTESQAIAAVVSFIVLLLSFLMGDISGMIPTDALTQCMLLSVIWVPAVLFLYRILANGKVAVGSLFLGEAVIWVIYAVKASVYEGFVNHILEVLAVSDYFDDFKLGILNYDVIVYYISIILLALFLTIQVIKNQQHKSGAYSSVLIVLLVGIVVVLNLVFSKLDLTTDLSSGSLFTLSKETKKVMKELEQDVTIYYMVQEGDEESYIDNVLKQYKKVSSHVTVKKVDPVVNPGFAKKQGIEDEVVSNDVIVVNKKTNTAKYLSGTELYYSTTDYSTGSASYYLDVEGKVTSAIQNVSSTEKTKLYIMTKHSEQVLGDSLYEALEKMNITTEELELAKQDGVPKDCDILLLNGPEKDLTDAELKSVQRYLKRGGSAMITLSYTTEKTPNLDKLLKEYGILETKGIVIEGTGNYVTYVNNVVPAVEDISGILSDLDGYIVFPNASGMKQIKDASADEKLSITELLNSSDASFVKADPSSDSAEKEKEDVDGPFSLGFFVEKEQGKGKNAKLFVYSSAYAFTENLTYSSQLENANVFKNSIRSMTASDVEEVSVDKKDLSYSYISITPVMQMFWAAVVILVIPAGLLLTGFVIWFARRKK